MPICKHCGESVYQTRGGSWVHEDGRGICSGAEPADPLPTEMPSLLERGSDAPSRNHTDGGL